MPPRQTSTAGGWGLVGPSLGGTMVIKKPEQVVPDPSRSDGGFSTVKLPPFKESFSPKSPTPTTMNVSPFEKQYPLPDGWNLNRVKGKKNLYGDGLDAHYRLFDPSGKELPQTTQLGTQGPVGSRGKIVHEGLLSNTPEVPPHVGRAMLAALLGVVQSSQRPLDALPINKGLGEMLLKLDASGRLPITDKTRRAATNAANPKPGQSYVDGRKWFFPNAD